MVKSIASFASLSVSLVDHNRDLYAPLLCTFAVNSAFQRIQPSLVNDLNSDRGFVPARAVVACSKADQARCLYNMNV